MSKLSIKKIINLRTIVLIVVLITVLGVVLFQFTDESKKIPRISPFPNGKNFAFTITADPDYNKLENDRIIYDFLTSIGMRTTVAVWVKDATRTNDTYTEINVPADNSFNWAVDDSFSIEFWVKRNGAVTGDNQVAIGRDGPATSLIWWVGIGGDNDTTVNQNAASFVLGDTDGSNIARLAGNTDITDNEWHHVVAVRDRSLGDNGQNLLYVDGQLDVAALDATYDAGFGSAKAEINIGYLDLATGFHLEGGIDEVALYDRALTPDEIEEHFEAGEAGRDYCLGDAPFGPFPDDIISLWRLDETAGPNYADALVGNDGMGGSASGAADPAAIPPPGGRVNGAQAFNGSPDMPKGLKAGDSCEREEYLHYMQELQKRGFEIALHSVSAGNDFREETVNGYEKFKIYFNHYPKINIMHQSNLENLYWGTKVVNYSFLQMLIKNVSNKTSLPFEGEIPGSKYFWGDIAKEKTKYIRLWGTKDINTLNFNQSMPYHDPEKPFVNYWFSFSDGWNVKIFNDLLSQKNIHKLAEERGVSIVYTHFASGFVKNGQLNDTFQKRMRYLAAQKDGWFVPASTILDRLLLIKKIIFQGVKNSMVITNLNKQDINGITLLVPKNSYFYDPQGTKLIPNEEGELIIDLLKAGETTTIFKDHTSNYINREYPTTIEKITFFLQRSLVYISHNF